MRYPALLSLLLTIFCFQTIVLANPPKNPVEAMLGTRTQTGTMFVGQKTYPIASQVTCTATSSQSVVLCHGQSSPTFSWLDAFDWRSEGRMIIKTSLGTIPGQSITTLKGEWNPKTRTWSLSGIRENNNGSKTMVRSTRQISAEGIHRYRYFETKGDQEVLILDITERPLQKK